eukprot:756206-Hanusia_phi.AAC.1
MVRSEPRRSDRVRRGLSREAARRAASGHRDVPGVRSDSYRTRTVTPATAAGAARAPAGPGRPGRLHSEVQRKTRIPRCLQAS